MSFYSYDIESLRSQGERAIELQEIREQWMDEREEELETRIYAEANEWEGEPYAW